MYILGLITMHAQIVAELKDKVVNLEKIHNE